MHAKSKKLQEIIQQMNEYGAHRVPFLFIFDFEMQLPKIYTLDNIPKNIFIKFLNYSNRNEDLKKEHVIPKKDFLLQKFPISEATFKTAFDGVLKEINYGNSFLLNLTFPTEIKINYTLKEIFDVSKAKYKLYFKNKFVCFSPETFIKIKDNHVYSYPMKGTIDASIKDAEKLILANPKEEAEHYTIVDLIRNDISQVAEKVEVTKFRYVDKIITHDKTLLQVSSEIKGKLKEDWREQLGDIFSKLLPAGSISGAPKLKTTEIIKRYELDSRGYYTGVAGIFDGDSVDSCVMIRFIENKEDRLYFRSGGGITFRSKEAEEYQELIQKIYVPIF